MAKSVFLLKNTENCAIKKSERRWGYEKKILAITFALVSAIFLSLALACLLNLLGMAMAISLDGPSVTKQYPRFIPFCLTAGIVALAAMIVTFILNLKASEKFEFTKNIWITEIVIAFVTSISMIKPWEMLFEFLQKTF